MTSLAAVGWLQNAIKYCTKVRKTGLTRQSRIIQSLFSLESPYVDLVLSRTGYDVTNYFWSAYIKVKKTAATALGRVLVAQHFACLTQPFGGLLVW